MIELTLIEKRTIYHILILIMEADLVIMQEEVDFLDNVFNDFGLTREEFDHMENLDVDSLCRDFSVFDKEVKLYAKDLFMGMAKCDGYVDPREQAIIDRLCK